MQTYKHNILCFVGDLTCGLQFADPQLTNGNVINDFVLVKACRPQTFTYTNYMENKYEFPKHVVK